MEQVTFKRKENKYKNIYYLATVISIIKILLTSSTIAPISSTLDDVLTIFIAILFFIKLSSQTYTIKRLLLVFSVGIICLYISIVTNEYVIMISFLAIVALKNIDIKQLLKIGFATKFIIIGIHVFIYLIHYYTDNVIGYKYYNMYGDLRCNFYLGNPNFISGIIMWMMLEYTYINYKKMSLKHIIIFIIISILIYRFTFSRTVLIASIIAAIIIFIKKTNKFDKIIMKISNIIFPVISILMILLCASYYKIPYANVLDELLSRRISLGYLSLEKYEITLLPHKVYYDEKITWKDEYTMQLTVDSIYIRIAISYGLLLAAFLFFGFYKQPRNNVIYIILFAIVGITENYILNAFICFPLLFIGEKMYRLEEKNE